MKTVDTKLRAFADAVKGQLSKVRSEIKTAGGSHRLEFPAPVIDMQPVAEAIDRMAALIGELIKELAKRSEPPKREKRKMKIRHADGSESTVAEV